MAALQDLAGCAQHAPLPLFGYQSRAFLDAIERVLTGTTEDGEGNRIGAIINGIIAPFASHLSPTIEIEDQVKLASFKPNFGCTAR